MTGTERAALLWFESWAGKYSKPVVVIGETKHRYRVRIAHADFITLPNGRRLTEGRSGLVPKDAITFPEAAHG